MNALLLFWPAFTVLLSWMQGALMPAIRRTPPGPEAERHDVALHYVGTAAYLLPLVLVLPLEGSLWPHVATCLLSRALLFDVLLNTAAGDQPFAVGRTARTDKLLRKLSPARPERLSALLRVGVLVAAAALLLSGCRTGRDVATPHGTTAANIAQAPGIIAQPASNATQLRGNAAGYVAITPPAPNAPASQHRQYRRNLRAQPRTVPLIQGRAAVNAPLASQVLASYKPKGPVVQADSGATVQVAVAAKNAQAAAGEGIQQQRVEPTKPTIWQRLTSLVGGLTSTLSWLLLGAVLLHAIGPGVGYGSGWLRRFVSKRSA